MKTLYLNLQPTLLKSAAVLLSALLINACTDFIEVAPPKTSVTSDIVFENEDTALAATLGMYDLLTRINSFGASGAPTSVSALAGLLADEFINYSTLNDEFATNNLSPANPNLLSLWSSAYSTIYTANAVIEGLHRSTALEEPLRKQFEGEAKFVRAFCLFYLANLFGDIPIITVTDYRVNQTMGRSPVQTVYNQVIIDLKEAQTLLTTNYPTADRARVNQGAATALLARVHLYAGHWVEAETESTRIIDNPAYQLEDNLNNVFLANSHEAIWQLASTGTYYDTYEGLYFKLSYTPSNQSLSEQLTNSFDPNDKRLASWIGSLTTESSTYRFPHKYKVDYNSSAHIEHSIALRLAEQYLIRAEARAQQNNFTQAVNDLNVIRTRAGLPNATAESNDQWLLLIEQERSHELFSEWGHRWFDLKRTGRATAALGTKSGWSTHDLLLPLPEMEMKNNPALAPQNPGY